ncbi:DUF4114 domain-containing protein [Myxacorys almedinensis]|uniref:DUF4114 domain-containing protein n=1 Tax=Myxacorys almedinensis A TaxID=2690445 RepID=A0A8J7Z0Z7_9CYAN|nr:DUF4114 domain-containing protein [Myxacorys almedinensis]NDJ18104.1 DUF4114 domain-containing protein [Myxacorys almedinensis A]
MIMGESVSSSSSNSSLTTDIAQAQTTTVLDTTVPNPLTPPPVGSSSSALPAAPQDQVFDLRSFAGKLVRGLFNTVSITADYDNTVGVYRIEDDQGTVIDPTNGRSYAPGSEGYSLAAVRRSQADGITFSARAGDVPVELQGGAVYAPYLVANNTVESVLQGTGANVYFNFTAANADGFDHFRTTEDGKIAVEDLFNGGDQDFNDAIVSATFEAPTIDLPTAPEDQVLDLRSQGGKAVRLLINSQSITADYENTVGLYRIEDALGTVIDPSTGTSYKPGDDGYGLAIVRRSQADGVTFSARAGDVDATLDGGNVYATYLIADATVDDVTSGRGANVYSNFVAANADGFDHFIGSGTTAAGSTGFSIEDLFGGGDLDFNDAIVTITFESAEPA